MWVFHNSDASFQTESFPEGSRRGRGTATAQNWTLGVSPRTCIRGGTGSPRPRSPLLVLLTLHSRIAPFPGAIYISMGWLQYASLLGLSRRNHNLLYIIRITGVSGTGVGDFHKESVAGRCSLVMNCSKPRFSVVLAGPGQTSFYPALKRRAIGSRRFGACFRFALLTSNGYLSPSELRGLVPRWLTACAMGLPSPHDQFKTGRASRPSPH